MQGDIPYSVTHLTFGDKFNQPLPKGCIPSSVTHLTFGQEFECQILPGDIPNSVTYLTFGAKFNQLKPRLYIPDSVMHLTFGTNFDSPVVIPDSVTHLTFGSCFNQASVVIPPSVTHLTFGLSFYQPIRSSDIPDSVTHLTFYRPFNSSSPKVAIHPLSSILNVSGAQTDQFQQVHCLNTKRARTSSVPSVNTSSTSQSVSRPIRKRRRVSPARVTPAFRFVLDTSSSKPGDKIVMRRIHDTLCQ